MAEKSKTMASWKVLAERRQKWKAEGLKQWQCDLLEARLFLDELFHQLNDLGKVSLADGVIHIEDRIGWAWELLTQELAPGSPPLPPTHKRIVEI